MKQYIQNFKLYFSESLLTQEKANEWIEAYFNIKDKSFFKRYAVKPEHIHSRQVYAKGIADLPFTGEALYSLTEEKRPSLNMRSDHAQEKIEEIFHSLYKGETKAPNHLNHVSCTHYQSPSAAQKMIVSKEWFNSTTVTHLYHMGCYASLPAVRVSKAFIADGA